MRVSDTNKNRGAHGDSSFKLGGMPSSSENPPALAVGSVKDYLYCAFERWKDDVADKVSQCMKNVTDLSGPWSVDIMMTNYPENIQRRMMEDIGNKYSSVQHPVGYLIDMAVAERSAYWDQRPQKDE